jgi:hypothetical protein
VVLGRGQCRKLLRGVTKAPLVSYKASKADKRHGLLPADFNHGNNFQVQKVVLIPGPGTQTLFRTKISMVGYIARTKNK